MALLNPRGNLFVDPEEIDDPKCVRAEQFEEKTFRDYLLSRLESARDAASTEVLASVRGGRSLGDAVLDTIESLPASKTAKLKTWIEEARGTRIYAYVEFHSTSRLSYGLMLTEGSPKDSVVAWEEVGTLEMDNLAPYWGWRQARREIEQKSYLRPHMMFDEEPMVEVSDKEEYDEALVAMNIELSEGAWKKPGLYDFRDSPPTYSGTIEDYEREAMKYEAERTLEYMFDGGNLEDACDALLAK